jgi:hypothetical protein
MSQILLGKNRSNPEVGILLVESRDVRFCTKRTFRASDHCPLSGVKQTSLPHRKMSAYDAKRT